MSEFRTNDISLKIQKKLLGRMAKKNVAKMFIDDTSAQLLDNLHKLAKYNCSNKKDAEKVVKQIIKTIIKIGILNRNDQFSDSEIKIAHNFKKQFHSTAMTIVSFHELEFSYDRNYIIQSLNKCKSLLKDLVETHLSEKSLNRIEQVFNFFTKTELLDSFFRERDGDIKQLRSDIVRDMNKLLENGAI